MKKVLLIVSVIAVSMALLYGLSYSLPKALAGRTKDVAMDKIEVPVEIEGNTISTDEGVNPFLGMNPEEIVIKLKGLRVDVSNLDLLVGNYKKQLAFVYDEGIEIELEPAYMLYNGDLELINLSDFEGMTLEEVKDILQKDVNTIEIVSEAMSESLRYKPYVDVSQVYHDPNNDWKYVITLERYESRDVIQYIVTKYTFEMEDQEYKIIMEDRDYKYSFIKAKDPSSQKDIDTYLDHSIAGEFYGEKVIYTSRVNLVGSGLVEEIQSSSDDLLDVTSIYMEDLSTGEVASKDLYYDLKYPLAAKVEEKQVYLYGQDNGGILRVGHKLQALDGWILTTPRHILPQLYVDDIDMDGIEEIICISNVGSGTGISIDRVNVLKLNDQGSYDVYQVTEHPLAMGGELELLYDSDQGQIKVDIGSSSMVYSISKENLEHKINRVRINTDVIHYDYNDGINITVPVVLQASGVPGPLFTWLELSGRLEFSDGDFHLTWESIIDGRQ